MHFDIPNNGELRNKVLSSIATKWRQFKSKLTTVYVYGAKKGESPCSKYPNIDEATWETFVQTRTFEKWFVSILYYIL